MGRDRVSTRAWQRHTGLMLELNNILCILKTKLNVMDRISRNAIESSLFQGEDEGDIADECQIKS